MTFAMQISVVIPTYNRASLLPRALESVLNQDFNVHEIIVVDDGSEDETAKLISTRYKDVVYMRRQHRGVSGARNTGIKRARGDWIAFLDSDDEWLPGKLKIQTESLRISPEFKICHTDEIWIRNGRRVNPRRKHLKAGGWIYRRCLPLCVISPSCAIVHRSIFDTVGDFDETLPACEDYDLWLRICARYPVLFCDTPLINKYGGHEDQLSACHWGMDRFRTQALEKILAGGYLSPTDHQATLEMLIYKLKILARGAIKHRNDPLHQVCAEKLTRYQAPPAGTHDVWA